MEKIDYQRKYNNRKERHCICSICGAKFSTFYQHKKTCSKECSRALYEINKRKGRAERTKEWRKNNPDLVKEQNKRSRENWVASGKEKEYLNRDDIKEKNHFYEERWRKNNPLKKRLINRRRKSDIRIDHEELEKRLNMFNGCCYCGQQKQLTIEHLVPVSRMGTDAIYNLFGACPRCNSSKGNKSFLEWYRQQKFYNHEREYKILQNYLVG